MDPATEFWMDLVPWILGGGILISLAGIWGWTQNTRLKIKNGYPLETMWGFPMHPKGSSEDAERVKLLTQENAQLRAEIGSIKDRLANVERIVTDSGYRIGHEIDRLREEGGKVQ